MFFDLIMDDELMPCLSSPSHEEELLTARISEEKLPFYHRGPSSTPVLRANSVDADNVKNQAFSPAKSAKKVIAKSSSSHKFLIINYGRSSIPNSQSPIGSSDSLRTVPSHDIPGADECDKIVELPALTSVPHFGGFETADKCDSALASSFVDGSDKNVGYPNSRKQEKPTESVLVPVDPSPQETRVEVVELLDVSRDHHHHHLSPDVEIEIIPPANISKKNSLTPFFIPKHPTGHHSYWKNKTSKWNEIAKIGRIFTKRNKLRLIQQSGECNVVYSNVDKRSVRYLTDLFTTLLELKWRYNALFYLVSFVMSWIFFALIWWAMHAGYGLDENDTPCVIGVTDFKTALLFSIETQQTIGYGTRAVTERCTLAYFLIMLQSIFGAVTQCVVTGIIFSKLARPNRRAETVIFSKKAVICKSSHDPASHWNLEFRVGDIRNSQLIGVRISALLVRKRFERNGRQVELQQKCLKIATESDDDFFFLAWPIKVIHRIDPSSPFWNSTPKDIALADFEILIVLEANCESTGGTVQVKTSYLPSEIIWGGRLAPLFTRTKYNGRYKVDYSRFNEILTDDSKATTGEDVVLSHGVRSDTQTGGGGGKEDQPSRSGHYSNFKIKRDSTSSFTLDDASNTVSQHEY